jgi:hypothetical protein
MTDSSYYYLVTIMPSSSYMKNSGVENIIANCNEMVITSNEFQTYEECGGKLMNLLSDIASTQSSEDGKNFVIVSKLNPIFSGVQDDGVVWPKSTLARCYLVDSDLLKSGNPTFEYSVAAFINVKSDSADLK